jgi:hypothetical protein
MPVALPGSRRAAVTVSLRPGSGHRNEYGVNPRAGVSDRSGLNAAAAGAPLLKNRLGNLGWAGTSEICFPLLCLLRLQAH